MASNVSFPLVQSSRHVADGGIDIDAVMENITIVLYTLTIVLGVTGNSVVIWMAGVRLPATVTNVWLVNLAVADLVFCMTRVTSLVKNLFFNHWPFGVFLCKFNGFFKYANMFCSVFLLAVISLDRVLCVWRPVFTKSRRTLCAARLVSLAVWAGAGAMSAPYFAYRQVYLGKNNLSKCSLEVKEAAGADGAKMVLYSIRFLCGFLLPFLIILSCYVLAGIGIRRTRLKGKSRPLRILAGLVCAFFLCWGPYHCLLLAKMADKNSSVVKVGLPLAKGVAYFNSCVNPLLYFCMGVSRSGRCSQGLLGVYRRALAEEGVQRTTQSNERSTEGSSGPAHQLSCSDQPG